MIVQNEFEIENAIREHKEILAKSRIASLTKIADSVNPCTNGSTKIGWKKFALIVDSGACENVIDAGEEVPNYPVKESRASKMGVKCASATGEEIPNL